MRVSNYLPDGPSQTQQVTLVVEGEEDSALGLTLLEQLAEGHPYPDRPRAVEWRERFEETATGKVRRR